MRRIAGGSGIAEGLFSRDTSRKDLVPFRVGYCLVESGWLFVASNLESHALASSRLENSLWET